MIRARPIYMAAILALLSTASFAQESLDVAVVNGQSISLNLVHRFLDRSFENLPALADRANRNDSVVQIGIEHCIKREIILQHLRAGNFKTSSREIDHKLEEIESQLSLTDQKLENWLSENRLSEAEFRRELEWQISWRKYVAKFVTVEHLNKQFEQKRKYFDGTKYHVAQILWKQSSPETLAKAKLVRQQLLDKTIDWKTAVEQNSAAASAKNEGDLGWIGYSGPMPRGFTQIAFGLSEGEFSQPYSSKFGTHLIRCVEVSQGTKTFEDVILKLREIETNRLFELVSKRQRADAKIEINPTKSANASDSSSSRSKLQTDGIGK